MQYFLFIFLVLAERKSMEVHYTDIAPKIDGFIEETWIAADSA